MRIYVAIRPPSLYLYLSLSLSLSLSISFGFRTRFILPVSDSVNAGTSVASFSQRLHVKISFTVLIFSLDFAITVIIIFITIIITSDTIIIIIIMITDTCYSFLPSLEYHLMLRS